MVGPSTSSSNTSFDFSKMITELGSFAGKVKDYLSQLTADKGSVDLGTMFNMQFHMQMLSQFVEATSNTLTAVHGEMVNMAKAVKGQ